MTQKIMSKKQKKIKIFVEGSARDIDKIRTLFQLGELEELLGVSLLDVNTYSKNRRSTPILISHLSSWFQNNRLEGWRYISRLEGTFFEVEDNLAFATRHHTRNEILNSPVEGKFKNEISSKINNLKLALELGESNNNSPEIIAKLVDFLQICEDKETSWQLALSLRELVKDHPQAAIAQTKEFKLLNWDLELLVGVKKRQDRKLDILLQLYPVLGNYVPPELTLVVLDSFGFIKSLIQTKSEDKLTYISSNFTKSLGEQFTIEISLEDDMVKEYFQV